ncbi:hypothetical protein Goari_014293, partial [Gossypium aridum]|nr:hypothetical protein [Gossypium aridum]
MVIREIWRVYSAQWVRRLVNDDECLRCGEAAETTSHACQDCLCAGQQRLDDGVQHVIGTGTYLKVEGDSLMIISKLRIQGMDRSEGGLHADEEGLHSEARCSWVKEGPVAIRE